VPQASPPILHTLSAQLHGQCAVILFWKLEISHSGSVYDQKNQKKISKYGNSFFFLSQLSNFLPAT